MNGKIKIVLTVIITITFVLVGQRFGLFQTYTGGQYPRSYAPGEVVTKPVYTCYGVPISTEVARGIPDAGTHTLCIGFLSIKNTVRTY